MTAIRVELILGVDPGFRETGLVLIAWPEGELLDRVTVNRPGPPVPPGRQLLASHDADAYLSALRLALHNLSQHSSERPLAVAVEDVIAPSPHVGMTNPTGLLGTAITLGYVIAWAELRGVPIARVRPSRHGNGVPQQYPSELLDRGGTVAAGGKRRHERSAYDVALHAGGLLRLGRLYG